MIRELMGHIKMDKKVGQSILTETVPLLKENHTGMLCPTKNKKRTTNEIRPREEWGVLGKRFRKKIKYWIDECGRNQLIVFPI